MRVTTLVTLTVTLWLFGCRTTDSPPAPDAAGFVRVPGKPRVAYLRVPKAIHQAGMSGTSLGASYDADGEGMTVRAATPDRRKFTIIFRPDGPDASRVGIAWEGEPDDALGRKIVAGLSRD